MSARWPSPSRPGFRRPRQLVSPPCSCQPPRPPRLSRVPPQPQTTGRAATITGSGQFVRKSNQCGMGAAVKLAYKTVNKFSPGHVRYMVEVLLPQRTNELEPDWAQFTASGGPEFGDYLVQHGDAVTEALLSVTDARGAASNRPVITKAYGAVRDKAARHVTA